MRKIVHISILFIFYVCTISVQAKLRTASSFDNGTVNLVIEEDSASVEDSSQVESSTIPINYQKDIVGKRFLMFIENSDYKERDCSFLKFSAIEIWDAISFKEDSVIVPCDEDCCYLSIGRICNGKNEVKMSVQEAYSNMACPWILSFVKEGILKITNAVYGTKQTNNYICVDNLSHFTCLYPYKHDYEEEYLYSYGEEYEHYYLLEDSVKDFVRYIEYYKGCPLRLNPDNQSGMIRYLLFNEPVRVLKSCNDMWVEVEDVFGNKGYVEKNKFKKKIN